MHDGLSCFSFSLVLSTCFVFGASGELERADVKADFVMQKIVIKVFVKASFLKVQHC